MENTTLVINISLINDYMKNQNKSLRRTAKDMDVSYSYLRKILNHEKNPGKKIILGLVKLGYHTGRIFIKKSIKTSKKSAQDICDYMNSFSSVYNKNDYTIDMVYKLISISNEEYDFRQKQHLNLYGRTKEGKEKIYQRIVNLAKMHELNVTVNDIYLFKKCQSLEQQTRNVIDTFDDVSDYLD